MLSLLRSWRSIPLYFLLAVWVLLGLSLMIFLESCSCNPLATTSLLAALPSVNSLLDAAVFDQEIAVQHFSIMTALSPLLMLAAWVFPISNKEMASLIKKPEMAKMGVLVLFGLACLSLFLDFYTGILTLGLGRTAFGFAILSAIESSFLAIAIRYFKLTINKGDFE